LFAGPHGRGARQCADGQPQVGPEGVPACGRRRSQKLINVKLAFRADPNYYVENFKIINANTNEE
jgi:hypothetical protein